MRLGYEAAEKAYRANMAEQDRLYLAGGNPSTSEALEATATGEYLDVVVDSLRDLQKRGWRAQGVTKIIGVAADGWQDTQVRLISCEDVGPVRFVDKSGRDVTPDGPSRFVQHLTVIRMGSGWRVADTRTTTVQAFEGQPCASR